MRSRVGVGSSGRADVVSSRTGIRPVGPKCAFRLVGRGLGSPSGQRTSVVLLTQFTHGRLAAGQAIAEPRFVLTFLGNGPRCLLGELAPFGLLGLQFG